MIFFTIDKYNSEKVLPNANKNYILLYKRHIKKKRNKRLKKNNFMRNESSTRNISNSLACLMRVGVVVFNSY